MSMFKNFLENVEKAGSAVVQGVERQVTQDVERAVDRAAKRWARTVTKTAEQRAASAVAGFLSPAPESDAAYYERTGTLREDDWG